MYLNTNGFDSEALPFHFLFFSPIKNMQCIFNEFEIKINNGRDNAFLGYIM